MIYDNQLNITPEIYDQMSDFEQELIDELDNNMNELVIVFWIWFEIQRLIWYTFEDGEINIKIENIKWKITKLVYLSHCIFLKNSLNKKQYEKLIKYWEDNYIDSKHCIQNE